MKFPLEISCDQCGTATTIFINLYETSSVQKCVSCGNVVFDSLAHNITIGYKLLLRGLREIQINEDYPLSIVFSAAAFECELFRVYRKCKEIDAMDKGYLPSDQELEEELRKYSNILVKIKVVGELLDPRGFDEFVSSTLELREIMTKVTPNMELESPSKNIQEQLFWPRNRILHIGEASVQSTL
ncbi:MAG: hypothetical protein AABY87_11390 [bacterium]